MEFGSNFILIIIVIFLFYSFFKTRKKTKKAVLSKENVLKNTDKNYENHVVAAVIAVLMDDKKYMIKRIYQTEPVDEKKSLWKISGRQEGLNTRLFFRKK